MLVIGKRSFMSNHNHVWITWERQTRNRSMANALQASYVEYNYKKGWFRYIALTLKTVILLLKKRPEIIFFQNPSVVLGLVCVFFGALFKRTALVGDFHNCALDDSSRLFKINSFIARRCSLVIVTNPSLEKVVTSMGGVGVSFPDPLPDVEQYNSDVQEQSNSIVFVTSWANDEPINEVLDAFIEAKLSLVGVELLITGRPKFNTLSHSQDYYEKNHIVFLGFVAESTYWSLLKKAYFVIDLTTRDNCMVCGAYEALAVNRVLLLSGNKATTEYFGSGLVYTNNIKDDIREKLSYIQNNISYLCSGIVNVRTAVLKKQQENVENIKALLQKNRGQGV